MNIVPETILPLGQLVPGASGTVSNFDGTEPAMVDRLREMGFAEGLNIELLHQSPFGGDPIAVRIDSMTVALRRREANLIKVKIS